MFQVWAKDTYGHHEVITVHSKTGILESEWKTPAEAYAAAKRHAHDVNRNNPMTFDEQKRLVTCVVPEVAEGDGFYSGNLIMGRHTIVKKADVGFKDVNINIQSTAMRFYAGQDPENKPWYLETPQRKPVVSLEDEVLADKLIVFVHQES